MNGNSLIDANLSSRRGIMKSYRPEGATKRLSVSISHGRNPDGSEVGYKATLVGTVSKTQGFLRGMKNSEFERGVPEQVAKSASKLPSNGQWLTVHPNGHGDKGQPVYVVPNSDGTHSIVAGAGGKLNGMRISGVKSHQDYKDHARQQKSDHAEKAKAQAIAGERAGKSQESGLKAKESDAEKKARIGKEREFIAHASRVQGLPEETYKVPGEILAGKSPREIEAIAAAHHNRMLSYAHSVARQAKGLLTRAISEGADSAGLSAQDIVSELLSPPRLSGLRGVTLTEDQVTLAEKAGLDARLSRYVEESGGDVEAGMARLAKVQKTSEKTSAARKVVADALQEATNRGSGAAYAAAVAPTVKAVTAQDAAALAAHSNSIRTPGVTDRFKLPPASPMAYSETVDSEAIQRTADDLIAGVRSAAVSALVEKGNELSADADIEGHLCVGRHVGFSEALGADFPGLAASLPSSAITTLSAGACAAVLAQSVRSQAGAKGAVEFGRKVAQAHVESQVSIANAATEKVNALLDQADAFAWDRTASTPESIAAAITDNGSRMSIIKHAREVAGKALGALDGAAQLAEALSGPLRDVEFPVGASSAGDAARSVMESLPGLRPSIGIEGTPGHVQGDFQITEIGPGTYTCKLFKEGIEKAAPAPDVELQQRMDTARKINQSAPEENFLPQGIRPVIGAPSLAAEAATAPIGSLLPRHIDLIRKTAIMATIGETPDAMEPEIELGTEERAAWDAWQVAKQSGNPYIAAQDAISTRFPVLGSLNLDDAGSVLAFAKSNAAALGYTGVSTGKDEFYPALEGNGPRVVRDAKTKIKRLIRGLFSIEVSDAQAFDPSTVRSGSDIWKGIVQQSGGEERALSMGQEILKSQQADTIQDSKPLTFTPAQQKAVKYVSELRRCGIGLRAGGGKTLVMLASFSQARAEGKATRQMICAPLSVVGQLEQEHDTFVDTEGTGAKAKLLSGLKADERHKHYADPSNTTVLVTPETLRDDVLSAIRTDTGMNADAAKSWLATAGSSETDAVVHAALEKRGWNFDYLAYDEGHRLLNREGKEDSAMGKIADSIARRPNQNGELPYYVYSTADQVKNDTSEMFDVLHKVDPVRYTEDKKPAFMQKYNRGKVSGGISMKLETEPYIFTDNTGTGVKVNRQVIPIPLDPEQAAQHDAVLAEYEKSVSVQGGDGKLCPAEQTTIGSIIRDSKVGKVIDQNPQGAKARYVVQRVTEAKRPTVVFAKHRMAVAAIAQSLQEAGVNAGTIRGGMSGKARDAARDAFQSGQTDVLVCTDAAEAGLNLQRGNLLINLDVPATAKTHEQRIAREDRMGQKAGQIDVEDLVADCAWDKRNRERLEKKGALRRLTTTPLELLDDSGLAFQMMRMQGEIG